MSEEKYYTPTIDEFHVGFAVQVLNTEGMYQWGNYAITESDWGKSKWELFIQSEEVRVKKLDNDDILAEGWTPHEGFQYVKENIMWSGMKWDICCLIVGKNGSCMIELNPGQSDFQTLFQGTIRNRNKLRQIMQMTGIV